VTQPLSTVSDAPAAEQPSKGLTFPPWAVFGAVVLVVATVVRDGVSADAVAWAVVQVVLVGVAVYDFVNRRVKNAVTVPVSIVALALRAAFNRGDFVEVLVGGVVAFLAFFALALILRGGLGMGDVKLAGMLGFLLGEKVLAALFLGAIAGGVAGLIILTRSPGRRSTMAYGPYLALGAAAVILFSHPPALT
jgi:leader peptidase (prepilin peptidase)/N-methyltransferase